MHSNLLKPLGFKKVGGTFRRAHDQHIELYNIQSSAWNGTSGSSFYVNCGLVFEGIPLEYTGEYFAGTQWADRIETIVEGAPSSRAYSIQNADRVFQQVAEDILRASPVLANNLNHYKQLYLDRVERLNEIKARAKA